MELLAGISLGLSVGLSVGVWLALFLLKRTPEGTTPTATRLSRAMKPFTTKKTNKILVHNDEAAWKVEHGREI
jgi:hypothetical protein